MSNSSGQYGFGYVNSVSRQRHGIGLAGDFGWFVDKFRTKIGYTVSIIARSISAIAHAAVGSGGFIGSGWGRWKLPVGDQAGFPRRNALAAASLIQGTNVSAIIAPVNASRWRLGLALGVHHCRYYWPVSWLFWIPVVQRRKKSRASLPLNANIFSAIATVTGNAAAKTIQGSLLKYRQTRSFIFAKFMTDPVWWFLPIWLTRLFQEDAPSRYQKQLGSPRYHLRSSPC